MHNDQTIRHRETAPKCACQTTSVQNIPSKDITELKGEIDTSTVRFGDFPILCP